MIFFDTETCGYHGPTVLIQWAEDDGPTHLHSVWTSTVRETMALIEKIVNHPGGVCGFNLAFDWFHLCQTYTTLCRLPANAYPEDIIEQYALAEPAARDGVCLKPVKALDLMLFARKGPYQSTMDRKPVRVKRVPTSLAWQLAQELEKQIPLSDIYFAKRTDKYAPKWKIEDIKDKLGEIVPEFKDLVLNFAPSSALKVLAIDALKLPVDETLLFADVELDKALNPKEMGYAPFACAIGTPDNWNGAWPDVIGFHISHWGYYELARKYAEKDVVYLQQLYNHFGRPEMSDNDSELACMVAAVRWKGYNVDLDGIKRLKEKAEKMVGKYPTVPEKAKYYIQEVMDATERLGMQGSSARPILEKVARLPATPCVVCNGRCKLPSDGGEVVCDYCAGEGMLPHPAVERAENVLKARQAEYEIDFYDKLITAGRLHASFKVIGTLSSRMAGADGLNSQGIKNDPTVRQEFPLAWHGTKLCGGDFSSFEVVLAAACYGDPDLYRALTTKRPCHKCCCCKPKSDCGDCHGSSKVETLDAKGKVKEVFCHCTLRKEAATCTTCESSGVINRHTPEETWCPDCISFQPLNFCDDCWGTGLTDTKIHALFGQFVYPNLSYEEILANKLIYTRCKSAVFAMLYGGEAYTLQSRLSVDIEIAENAYEEFGRQFPGVARNRQRIKDMFESMKQPGGIGRKVEWHDPADYIESMFGFRRYFTLENRICKALFDLANDVPPAWVAVKGKVIRRDREQKPVGAVRSALYGAAFAIQAANTRAAGNHIIQSSGATITKHVQRRIWDIQPSGIGKWIVQPMNVHDEVMCPTDPAYTEKVAEAVTTTVESYRSKVPLINIEWESNMESWAAK